MKFDWRRPLAPILLVAGLFVCFTSGLPVIGLGVFLVTFALILGFSRGAEKEEPASGEQFPQVPTAVSAKARWAEIGSLFPRRGIAA